MKIRISNASINRGVYVQPPKNKFITKTRYKRKNLFLVISF
jgi:hypothetical protein